MMCRADFCSSFRNLISSCVDLSVFNAAVTARQSTFSNGIVWLAMQFPSTIRWAAKKYNVLLDIDIVRKSSKVNHSSLNKFASAFCRWPTVTEPQHTGMEPQP
jgi:hypothetical protein